ncbi:MAG: hypothetical protein V3T81_07240, partial [Thermoanaerobaculia bacterium]
MRDERSSGEGSPKFSHPEDPRSRHELRVPDRRGSDPGAAVGELVLPPGLMEEEWELERTQLQDPRLRAFLDCLRLLDDVLESDYSILH